MLAKVALHHFDSLLLASLLDDILGDIVDIEILHGLTAEYAFGHISAVACHLGHILLL